MTPKFSVCIPNFNYEKYLGRTIQSILDQTGESLEILVSDNASTDGSVAVVKAFDDPRIKLHVNACNVGFSGNLDRAAHGASGELMIMLSSDDLIRPGALTAYRALFDHLGAAASGAVASTTFDVIDPQDRITGSLGPITKLWTDSDRREDLETLLGAPVYGVPAGELLKRCIRNMANPFNFAATVYPAGLYRRIEGYGGGRLFNPDKWFHWRLLGAAEMAYFIDKPLFAYRWHGDNQAAQESATSALKFLIDEYASTLELDARLLDQLGLSRDEVFDSFVERDIARHGLATLARGQRLRARRILDFGKAAYPAHLRRNKKAWVLRLLLALGPLGRQLASIAYRRIQDHGQTP